MKVIRLTYPSSEIEPSVYLLLFFRFVGIYVYERFWERRTVRMDKRELSGADVGRLGNRQLGSDAFDCDICIARDTNDLQVHGVLENGNSRCVLLLTKGWQEQGSINYAGISELTLVNRINNELLLRGLITPNEQAELNTLAGIFDANKLMKLTLQAKYFFTIDKESYLTVIQKGFEDVVAQLLNNLNVNGCTWGQRHFFYTQYATLNAIYELNCFCVRYKRGMVYSKESLLWLCDALETGIDWLLGDSVKMLKGQIYDNLFLNPNEAYELYVNCCNENAVYNSYVYFRKGIYWQDFGNDWKQALKYYEQAVYIYPEYYRAWFKVGFCNQNLGRNREAVTAYENVRKCLAGRIEGKCVRPMEIEHIIKAQVQIAEIWEKNGNQRNAIEALNRAEQVWNLIDGTNFYDLMCITLGEKDYYKRKTKDNLNIQDVYDKLIVLNTIAGNREAVSYYHEKFG